MRGDAACLPFATAAFGAVACSMAIMLLQPLDETLSELARVLAPGGIGVLMLPGRRPLKVVDLARYAHLMTGVRRLHLSYPNDRAMARLPAALGRAGLTVTADERRRFTLRFADRDAIATFVNSLYLPGVPARRVDATVDTLKGWIGIELGVPLRRVVFSRV